MDVVVIKAPDGWTAHRDQVAVGKAAALVRPDDRCFVVFGGCRADAYEPLVQAIAQHIGRDLYTEIGEADIEVRDRLLALGFVVNRREHTYTIPTDPAVTGLTNVAAPVGFEIVTADRVSADRLRELDNELKQDVPGADGWKWDRQGFRKEPTTPQTSIRPPIWWPSSRQPAGTPGWSGSGTAPAAPGSA